MSLPSSFFDRPTVAVARDLLGQVLVRRFEDRVFRSEIVEVEAYTQDDPACHAFGGRKPRCEVMFGPAGYAYVYFIYGMYHCLNVVTEGQGVPGAVLIRGLAEPEFLDGPGKICRHLAIDRSFNGMPLFEENLLSIEAGPHSKSKRKILATPRIGLSKAQDRLWRFVFAEQ